MYYYFLSNLLSAHNLYTYCTKEKHQCRDIIFKSFLTMLSELVPHLMSVDLHKNIEMLRTYSVFPQIKQ